MKLESSLSVYILLILTVLSCDNFQDKQSQFIGTWRFVSLSTESAEGDVFLPYGNEPYGRLMYDSKGNMSAFLMRPNRSRFVSGDIYSGTAQEIKSAFENFDAYCGTYKINAEKKTVIHFVEGSRFPNWEGTEQVRFYEFKNDTLILSASLNLKGMEWTASAVLVKL